MIDKINAAIETALIQIVKVKKVTLIAWLIGGLLVYLLTQDVTRSVLAPAVMIAALFIAKLIANHTKDSSGFLQLLILITIILLLPRDETYVLAKQLLLGPVALGLMLGLVYFKREPPVAKR